MLYVHKKIIRRILTKLLIIATFGEWEPGRGLKIRETRLFFYFIKGIKLIMSILFQSKTN